MSVMSQTLTFILAAGRDDRISPIVSGKPKSLLSFGGVFSVLDFTLSNCLNSDVDRAYVLTRYKSGSISRYLESASWNMDLVCVPPRFPITHHGTADLLYENIDLIRHRDTRYVLILTADHVYKMNCSRLVRFHASHGGDATIVASRHQRRFSSDVGAYVFNASVLYRELLRNAARFGSNHDSEPDVLSTLMARSERVAAYDFAAGDSGLGGYYRSLDTIDGYYRAQMELLATNCGFDPYQDARWPIYAGGRPAVSCVVANRQRLVLDSIVSEGCEVSGAAIIQSVVSPSVTVAAGAKVIGSIIMRDARIGRGAQIRRAIICEGVVIPEGERIGFDDEEDRGRFFVTENGVAVVDSTYARRLQGERVPLRIAQSA
jgi:glucose-1-phosphate adenylyltransferase